MDDDNLEGDLDAWVDRELIAAMKVRSQIYREGPVKTVGEISEEKIEAARNERLRQQRPKSVEEKIEAARNWRLGQHLPEQS